LDLSGFKIIEQADQIGDEIWEEVILWKYFEKETIGKQLVRSADSVSANLSEAYGRYGYADRKRFAYYARGSLCETINWLQKSSKRGLIKAELGLKIQTELNLLSMRINAYIKYLKQH
jgi:four helix bundle protein